MIKMIKNVEKANEFRDNKYIFNIKNDCEQRKKESGSVLKLQMEKDKWEFVCSHKSHKKNNAVMLFYNKANNIMVTNPTVIKSMKRLEDIARLGNDWNGYGATKFTAALILKCEKIIEKLSYQPEIYPTGRKSIQFQYELNDKSYLEFEIYEDKIMCLMVPKRVYSKAVEMQLTDSQEKRIGEIVDEFYRGESTKDGTII